jgi:hypothetical protein
LYESAYRCHSSCPEQLGIFMLIFEKGIDRS